ncbi:hypothetical protein C0J52_24259 [Blattella germanica]|nr:hypothetical protein C0J52_24259 [Blattella germanica]
MGSITKYASKPKCVCKLCSEKCPKYHVLTCKKNNKSITELSSEDRKLEILNSCTLVRAFLLLKRRNRT